MKLALRVSLLVITAGCAWMFIKHPLWFPVPASAEAERLDHQFRMAFALLGGLFLAGQFLLLFVMGRSSSGQPSRGDWRKELAWTIGLAGALFWFNFAGGHLWSEIASHESHAGDVRVEITGVQFQWYFRYPGPDGVFGRVDPQKFARAEEGNPLGLDPSDPAGQDDFVSTVMVIPAGHAVEMDLRALDVVHSVFIPAMRFKQDAVPGMDIRAHITTTELGTYELACAELCGLGHYRMQGKVRVVSEREYADWLQSHQLRPEEH